MLRLTWQIGEETTLVNCVQSKQHYELSERDKKLADRIGVAARKPIDIYQAANAMVQNMEAWAKLDVMPKGIPAEALVYTAALQFNQKSQVAALKNQGAKSHMSGKRTIKAKFDEHADTRRWLNQSARAKTAITLDPHCDIVTKQVFRLAGIAIESR